MAIIKLRFIALRSDPNNQSLCVNSEFRVSLFWHDRGMAGAQCGKGSALPSGSLEILKARPPIHEAEPQERNKPLAGKAKPFRTVRRQAASFGICDSLVT